MRFRRPLLKRLLPAAVALVLAAGGAVAASVVPASAGTHRGTTKDVVANLFEWNWPSVGTECRTVLGPAGYWGVQVAPPQDSLKRTATGNGSTVLHPWWEVYQPTDYGLTSRMGSPTQFRAMVKTCRAAGVKVIVDAVINHMSAQGDTSYGGTHYTKYDYPGVYTASDFHSYPKDCPVPPATSADREGSIRDFNDYRQVYGCELLALADLDTSQSVVRDRIAGYLNTLIADGVSGFRVDAAKHIGQTDLAAIESRLRRTVDGDRPYLALEVSTGSPGRISPSAFTDLGNVLGFDYTQALYNAFVSYDDGAKPRNDGNIGDLKVFGQAAGLPPSADEFVFVANHDTERGSGQSLSYKDPDWTIANEFMLAYPYGRPEVYSGFAFGTDTSQSPPSTADGLITDTNCANGQWTCTDRATGVTGMVGFHNRVGDAPVRDWYDDGTNLIAFSRGDLGFFATNNETAAKTVTVRTTLPAGRYCDVIHGAKHGGTCTGPTVVVRADGTTTITVRSYDSVAFTRSDRM